MDAVITYVDGSDPIWREEYSRFAGPAREGRRFRDWGTLKYLLRGISANMPFVENVFLVVSSDSQVPEWLSPSVRVVRHAEIIPSDLLPCFNSCTIEIFLPAVPGLSEEFLYFNDDVFPLRPCRPEDFFRDGKTKMRFSREWPACGMYRKQCRNSSDLARKALGMPPAAVFVRPQHTCAPMLRSACLRALEAVGEDIGGRVSRFRSGRDANQYFFQDYLYYSGLSTGEGISSRNVSTALRGPRSAAAFLENPSVDIVCLNDVEMPWRRFEKYRRAVLETFGRLFPEKSRFEK